MDILIDTTNNLPKNFLFEIQDGRQGQRSKLTKFDPTNNISAWHTDSIHPCWIKIGMDILHDPSNKILRKFSILFPKSKMAAGVKGKKLNKFDPTNYILSWHTYSVRTIWTKFGTEILLDSTNKLMKEFLIFFLFFFKIQDGCRGSKVKN